MDILLALHIVVFFFLSCSIFSFLSSHKMIRSIALSGRAVDYCRYLSYYMSRGAICMYFSVEKLY